ncbi:ABC transporter permease [Roseomonas sp. KE2513]|uniref:ABC transporter permease n=1 Tax=Roseomonas sp. KE2513 TaxID=2479202 RepID=UPI0018DF7924|nr:ABC transporter permease [Roseomonas sp. KE2513]
MTDDKAATLALPAPAALRPSALPKRGKFKMGQADALSTAAVVIVLLGAMQIASNFVPDYIMPPPATVLRATWDIVTADELHVLITLVRLFASVAFSMLLGIVIGGAMGMFGTIRPALRAVIVIDTGIPALSWMLLAVFWFRDPETRIFFILTVILVPFFALSIYDGIRALPRDLVDVVESFRPSRWQVLRFLVIPHVVPYVFLTMKSVIGYAIRMVVFAELVASASGIGSRMSLAQSTFRIDQVFAWTFLLVLLNIGLQTGVSMCERIALKWRPEVEVR